MAWWDTPEEFYDYIKTEGERLGALGLWIAEVTYRNHHNGQAPPPMRKPVEEALSGSQRNAYEALRALFASYGLDSLAPKILEYVQNGYSADTITILLQDTQEYKQRFSANDARRAKGMPVLSPQEYLATETAYRQLMRAAGLPQGFYDTPDDFTNFLSKDVSPTELKTRVDLAVQATDAADATLKESLQRMGVGAGGMVAWFLDPDRAVPIIQREITASKIGAAALRNKLQYDTGDLRQWALRGVTEDQAAEGYGMIAGYLPEAQKLAAIYGDVYNQRVAEGEVFGKEAYAVEARKGLASKERATFGGSVGAARGGLSGVGGQR